MVFDLCPPIRKALIRVSSHPSPSLTSVSVRLSVPHASLCLSLCLSYPSALPGRDGNGGCGWGCGGSRRGTGAAGWGLGTTSQPGESGAVLGLGVPRGPSCSLWARPQLGLGTGTALCPEVQGHQEPPCPLPVARPGTPRPAPWLGLAREGLEVGTQTWVW